MNLSRSSRLRCLTALVGAACLALSCGRESAPRPLIDVPYTAGKSVEQVLSVRVGHGAVVRLARTAESVSARGPEGVAEAVVRGAEVWVVGRAPGVAELDIAGAQNVLATLRVTVEPQPVDAGPRAPLRAEPAVIQVGAGPEAAARWTFERGHGSVVRTAFDLKRVLVADPDVVDFIVGGQDVQLVAKRKGTTNLVLESQDAIELFAELAVVDPEELEAAQRARDAVASLPDAGASRWAGAVTQLSSGVIRRLEVPYALRRVAISDPCVADFATLPGGGITLEAHDVGRTRLFAWDGRSVRSVLDIEVTAPTAGDPLPEDAPDFLSAIPAGDCGLRNQIERCRRDPASADCGYLGRVVREGAAGADDSTLAARLFEQSCRQGHGFACADLAGLELAASHAPRAAELLEQACAAERSGAGADGELCALARALEACPRKDGAACTALGSAFQRHGQLGENLELERRYHDKGCKLGNGPACLALGSSYFGVESEQKRVSKLMDRACELGVAEGCAQIGYRYVAATGVAQDVPRGLRALERGCMLGSAGACRRIAGHYAYGEDRDAARSLALARQGCELDDGWSCDHVGFAYEYGEEAPQDPAKAREFYARACRLGEQASCYKAKPRRGLIGQWIESRWK